MTVPPGLRSPSLLNINTGKLSIGKESFPQKSISFFHNKQNSKTPKLQPTCQVFTLANHRTKPSGGVLFFLNSHSQIKHNTTQNKRERVWGKTITLSLKSLSVSIHHSPSFQVYLFLSISVSFTAVLLSLSLPLIMEGALNLNARIQIWVLRISS